MKPSGIPFICCLALFGCVNSAAQQSLVRTHEFSGTGFAVSHDGRQVAILAGDLCIHTLADPGSEPRCVNFGFLPREATWSPSDALLAVSGRLRGGINDAVWIANTSDPARDQRTVYTSSPDGPGVTYARVEHWVSDSILVVDDNLGSFLVDMDAAAVIDYCGFARVEGATTFIAGQNRWLGMGHSGRLNEMRVEAGPSGPTLSCRTLETATPGTWLRFEAAFADGRLMFSEQAFDRGTRLTLGADILITDPQLTVLERLEIGSPVAISPEGERLASVMLDDLGSAYLVVTDSRRRTQNRFRLEDYSTYGLTGDFSYERFRPSWSPSGKRILVPTAIARGSAGGLRLSMITPDSGSLVPVTDETGLLSDFTWLPDDRLLAQRAVIGTGSAEIVVYSMP